MSLSPKFSRAFSKEFEILPPVLYHYCPVSSFVEIIKSRQFWLTNFRCLNDPTDGIWLDSIFNKMTNYIDKKLDLPKEVSKEYEDLKKIYLQYKYESYVACFSENEDLLSQWRAYGDDGKGITIGFDLGKLEIPTRVPDLSEKDEDAIGVFDITYEEDEQTEHMMKIINDFSDNQEADVIKTVGKLKKVACVAKNPYFAEENEWRIIYRPALHYRPNGEIQNRKGRDLQFRCAGNRVIPYFVYDMPNRDDLIQEVILGPRNNNPPGMIKMLLSSCGFLNIRIRKSPIPYR